MTQIRTSRVANVKKTRWHNGNFIGDVMLAITPDDEAKLLPLVGKIVQIDTTFTVIGDQATLAQPAPAEKVPASAPYSYGAPSGGSGSLGDLPSQDEDEEDEDEEKIPAWFKNWLQGRMKK